MGKDHFITKKSPQGAEASQITLAEGRRLASVLKQEQRGGC